MKLSYFRAILVVPFLILYFAVLDGRSASDNAYFSVAPYVQLGYHFSGNNLTVCWLSDYPKTDDICFEYKSVEQKNWRKTDEIKKHSINGHPQLKLFSAELKDLPAGSAVNYRVSKTNEVLFQSTLTAPPAAGKPVDFAVFGDVGQGTEGESRVAALLKKKQAPLGIITGDIVYPIGTIRLYMRNLFPYLNSENQKVRGSAVMRSMLTVGVPGNHDLALGGGIDARNLELVPDSLSYFVLWKQPLNGPLGKDSHFIAQPSGSNEKIADFLKAAGEAYPRMSNFSFDYGNCHFLVLDGNYYVDWTDFDLRQWVENDLKKSKARWKFVAFHQPGFNSDWAHREEQRMRHLSDIFERCDVDICFSGHSHSYQRSHPLRFKLAPAPVIGFEEQGGYVYGTFKMDKTFDGEKNTKANGVIYIVSGAGGARLTGAELENQPGQWLPFTKVFTSRRHSVTYCHVDGKKLAVDQIATDGTVVDHFVISK